MLTSLFHANTLLVLSSALPVSLSISIVPPPQLRESPSGTQPGPVVGLLLYATGNGMCDMSSLLPEREERMRIGSVVATYYVLNKQSIN